MPTYRMIEELAADVRKAELMRDFRLRMSLFHRSPSRAIYIQDWKSYQYDLTESYGVTPFVIETIPVEGVEVDQFSPEPTHVIRFDRCYLPSSRRVDCYRPCAMIAGDYKLCNWVGSRTKDVEAKPANEVLDFARLRAELHSGFASCISEIIQVLDGEKVGFFQIGFSPTSSDVWLRPFVEKYRQQSWRELSYRRTGYVTSMILGPYYHAILTGDPRVIGLDGRDVDLEYDQFESQFPDWIGFRRFDEQARECIREALAEAIVSETCASKLRWIENPTVVVESLDDYEMREEAELQLSTVVEGVEFWEMPRGTKRRAPIAAPLQDLERDPDPETIDFDLKSCRTVSFDEAAHEWAELVSSWRDEPAADGHALLEKLIHHYRNVRVQGASESLMLEWGKRSPFLLTEFTDLRTVSVKQGNREVRFVGISRRAMIGQEDDDPTIHVDLYFDAATGDERCGTIEIFGATRFNKSIERFFANRLVAELAASGPSGLAAYIATSG